MELKKSIVRSSLTLCALLTLISPAQPAEINATQSVGSLYSESTTNPIEKDRRVNQYHPNMTIFTPETIIGIPYDRNGRPIKREYNGPTVIDPSRGSEIIYPNR
jgi:hypothetical protein